MEALKYPENREAGILAWSNGFPMVLCKNHQLKTLILLQNPFRCTLYGPTAHGIPYRQAETDSQSLPVGKFGVFTIVGSVDNFKTGECLNLRRRRQSMTQGVCP